MITAEVFEGKITGCRSRVVVEWQVINLLFKEGTLSFYPSPKNSVANCFPYDSVLQINIHTFCLCDSDLGLVSLSPIEMQTPLWPVLVQTPPAPSVSNSVSWDLWVVLPFFLSSSSHSSSPDIQMDVQQGKNDPSLLLDITLYLSLSVSLSQGFHTPL